MSKYVKQSTPGTTSIATTSTTDEYLIAAKTGKLAAAWFSSLAALSAHDTNYLAITITNLGAAGSGSAAMLGTNNTKITGGSALVANTPRSLVLTSTAADLAVTEGDILLVRFTANGTLAGAVTRPIVQISIKTTQR